MHSSIRKAYPSFELIRCHRNLKSEFCFNVESTQLLSMSDVKKLLWLFAETFEPQLTGHTSFLRAGASEVIVEVGPRLAFSTAWSSNCVAMCQACGIPSITRVERSRRFLLTSSPPLNEQELHLFASYVHDRMTECVYPSKLMTFESTSVPDPVVRVPLLARGSEALEEINRAKGLGFDDWDIDFYTKMFTVTLGRDPTDVELFDLGTLVSPRGSFKSCSRAIQLGAFAPLVLRREDGHRRSGEGADSLPAREEHLEVKASRPGRPRPQ